MIMNEVRCIANQRVNRSDMTWPGWGDLLPSMTLVATIAALLWAVVRLLVRPVAEKAASEAEKRAAKATRATVDALYERLKANDFRHVEEGLKALGDRIDGIGRDFGGRLDRTDKRIAGVREDVGDRLELASRDRMDMEARLMAAIQGG